MNLAIHFVAYGYIKGIGIFYVALEKNEGKTMYVTLDNMALRSDNWIQANPLFEEEFNHNDDLRVFFSKMFMVWDGNHHLQAWLPIINNEHKNNPSWLQMVMLLVC